MHRRLQLLLILATATPAAALDLKLTGPAKVKPGNLAVFRLEGDPAKNYAWRVAGEKAQLFVDSAGVAAAFAQSDPGQYSIVAAASNDSGELVLLELTTTVEGTPPPPPPGPGPAPGPNPGPPPGPSPGPGPQPPAPDTPLGLTKTVYVAALLVPVEPVARAKQAAALAGAFETVASEAGAGKITTRTAFNERAKELNAAELTDAGGKGSDWAPVNAALAAQLGILQTAGKLATVEALRLAWMEIAAGLRLASR